MTGPEKINIGGVSYNTADVKDFRVQKGGMGLKPINIRYF